MIKLIVLLISLAAGATLGYVFYTYAGLNLVATIFASLGIFVGTLLLCVILFFVILIILGLGVDKKKQRTTQSKYYRRNLIFMERCLGSLFGMKMHFKGKEYLSTSESYFIVANHRSNLDSALIDIYLKNKPLVFIAKESLFKIPFVGKLIAGSGYLSLDRGNVKQEFEKISLAIDMLTRESNPISVAVFPEGTRNENPDNKDVQEFHPGTFRIAFKSRKPIAIIALRGTKEVNNNLLFKRHHCYLDIIEVLDYDQYKDMDVNSLSLYCHNKISNFLKENC